MKKSILLFTIGFIVTVSGSEEYTIQTISAKKESSITHAFEKKVAKSTLPSSKKREGECIIVTVGKYSDSKSAKQDMKKAKIISKDAFVRKLERITPKICDTNGSSHTSTKDQPHDLKSSSEHPLTTVSHTPSNPHAENEKGPLVATDHSHPAVMSTGNQITDEKPHTEASQGLKEESDHTPNTVAFLYDRNLLRKSDIADAIEYYKNSPYYSFRPIGLQQSK